MPYLLAIHHVSTFGFWSFVFVSDFVLSPSNLQEIDLAEIPPKEILNMHTICLVADHLDYKALPIVSNELGIIDSFGCKFR